MKKQIFQILAMLAFVLACNVAQSQVTYRATPVAATAVPSAIMTAFTTSYPNKPMASWEKHNAAGRASGADASHYVANFVHETRVTRARYRSTGECVLVTTFMGMAIPETIKSKAANVHPGYTLVSGERLVAPLENKTIYRLRYRLRTTTRVAYFDEQGNQLTANSLSENLNIEEKE